MRKRTLPDFERIGIFKEMSYISIGDPYKNPPTFGIFRTVDTKPFYTSGRKIRSGNNDGYFRPFSRIFEKECLKKPCRLRGDKKLLEKDWVPNSFGQVSCGLGTEFGTLGPKVAYFSPVERPRPKAAREKKNVLTSPPKKGTGYGYATVGLSRYPRHMPDPYEKSHYKRSSSSKSSKPFHLSFYSGNFFDSNIYTDNFVRDRKFTRRSKSAPVTHRKPLKPFIPPSPSKDPGGMKDGCFNPFPIYQSMNIKHSSDKAVRQQLKSFVSSGKTKSYPVVSVIDKNVQKSVNVKNYHELKGVVYAR